MSEITTYVKELGGLDLTFEECVYAIAFQLEDDLHLRGKEEVFSELPCLGQLSEKVQKVLGGEQSYTYALRKVLGFPTLDSGAAKFEREWKGDLEGCFARAMHYLRYGEKWKNYCPRLTLVGDLPGWGRFAPINDAQALSDKNTTAVRLRMTNLPDIYAKLEALTKEVQFYNKRRDQALAEIENLLKDIKQRDELSKVTSMGALMDAPQGARVVLQGPISQICWGYRSLQILREMGISTLAEAVEHFSNFDNFVKADEITFWEWAVINATLQREGLIKAEQDAKVRINDKIEDLPELGSPSSINVRTRNALRRASINNVQDIAYCFADGAEAGWYALLKARGLGKACMDHLVKVMGAWAFTIPLELCAPTGNSSIKALDFDRDTVKVLDDCKIETISDLIAACEDTNRFCGLRYLSPHKYGTAVTQLKKYGFRVS